MLKRLSVILITLVFLMIPQFIFATTYDSGFKVTEWDEKVEIDENDCYHVEETISVDFYQSRHGIYRNIPLKGVLERDGISSKYRAKVKNIEVSTLSGSVPYKVNKGRNEIEIKIGDPDRYADSHMTYIISYDYDFFGDRLKDGDEAYFNMLGFGWTSDIDLFNFDITLPKDFDENRVGVRVGNNIMDNYTVNGRNIVGSVSSVKYDTPISFRVILPDDYFEEASFLDNIDILGIFSFVVGIFLTLLGFIKWVMSSTKKEKLYEPVTLLPPKGPDGGEYYAYEMTKIYDGDSYKASAILSILFDLANEGYITIKEIKRKKYQFIKEKDYDGDDEILDNFMTLLFDYGDVDEISGKMTVTTKQLKNKFYEDLDFLKSHVNNAYSDDVLYTEESVLKSNKGRNILLLMMGIGAVGIILCFTFRMPIMLPLAIGVLLCPLCWGASLNNEKVLKPEYKKIRGEIGGFKNFLEKAEKPRLEKLVEEYPNYFYDILPYAYALGISDKYAKNFKDIVMEPPHYYDGSTNGFVVTSFVHDLNSGFSTVSSSPSSSSDGGGSFSGGGGGGGGGGGSW